MWLNQVQASHELRRHAGVLARSLPLQLDDAAWLAAATYGLADTLITTGGTALARTLIDQVPSVSISKDTAGILCFGLAAPQALLQATTGDDPLPPISKASEIAARYGESVDDPYGFDFGPSRAQFRTISAELETGNIDGALRVGPDHATRGQP